MLHGVLQRETTLSLMSCQCASTAGTTPGPPGHLHSRSLHTGSSTSQACMSVFSSTFCCHSIARLVEINSSTTQAYPARVFNYSTQPSNRRRPTAPQHSPCIALQRIYRCSGLHGCKCLVAAYSCCVAWTSRATVYVLSCVIATEGNKSYSCCDTVL